DGEPMDLTTNEISGVVPARRAAEDDGSGMAGHGVRQRIAQARAADVERIAALAQGMTDASRGRGFLVQHDQNRRGHGAGFNTRSTRVFKGHPAQPVCSCASARTNSIWAESSLPFIPERTRAQIAV